jgi:shikimate kinase
MATRRREPSPRVLSPDVSGRPGPSARHVVLVGVAAVGKTTLGRLVGPRVGIPFVDHDEFMEQRHGVSIAELAEEADGDARIDALLWEAYEDLMRLPQRVLVAASPRLLGRRAFWRLTRARAMSVHLRGTPLRVLRQDVALQRGIPLEEVRLTQALRAHFYRYYWWRLRHCQHADVELRLTGDLEADAARLAELVVRLVGGGRPAEGSAGSG